MSQSMRERILTAAVTVLRERGVTNTTTKEIARTAGVAEGSIYNHFANKTDLIAASMAEVAGGIREAMARLSGRVGTGTVEGNLTELAEAQIEFFAGLLPITGPVLGDRDLLVWLRRGGALHGEHAGPPPGPVLGHAGLTAYLEAERRAGRLSPGSRPPYLAAAILGACLQYAFLGLLTDSEVVVGVARLPAEPGEYAREAVRTVLAGHV